MFDDGLKTYIQFPVNMAATDAPPLFLVGPGGKAELVNYRYLNGYYVVDRLIDVAYPDQSSMSDLANAYRPWIVGALWLASSLMLVVGLRRFYRPGR